jgi:hypothetical protein
MRQKPAYNILWHNMLYVPESLPLHVVVGYNDGTARCVAGLYEMGDGTLNTVFKVLITAIFVAALIPVAISLFLGVDTSSWDATWVTIWNLLPLFVILIALALFVGMIVLRRGGFGAFAPVWFIPGVSEAFALYTAEIALTSAVVLVGTLTIRRMRRLARSDTSPAR